MSQAPVKVMLVDDDEEDRILTAWMLRRVPTMQVVLDYATTWEEGRDALLAGRHDVYLLDYRLGARDGLDLLGELGADRVAERAIIMMTGQGDRSIDVRATEAGAADYLVKGEVGPDMLERSIRFALERTRNIVALRKQADELARSNQELEQFARVVSHDLRSPLSIVQSYLELLQETARPPLGPTSQRHVHRALEAAGLMEHLITDLLAYACIDRGQPSRVRVALASALDAATAMLQQDIERAGATVTHGRLPAVEGDPVQVEQLFRNLVANAVKFRGAEPPRVEIGARQHPEGWLISVHDNGIGVASRDQDRIFGMFERGTADQGLSGTGIGLAICKKIVERHGGHIWVESEGHTGSTFLFTLPRRRAAVS